MRALAQCRGTSLIGAGKLSRYIGFILRVMARIRVHILVGLVLGAGFCKNRDKQLTHIVRSGWHYFLSRCYVNFFDMNLESGEVNPFFK